MLVYVKKLFQLLSIVTLDFESLICTPSKQKGSFFYCYQSLIFLSLHLRAVQLPILDKINKLDILS